MSSTVRSSASTSGPVPLSAGVVRWRCWPLVDQRAWSWIVPLLLVLTALIVGWWDGGLFLAIFVSGVGLTCLRSFLFPVSYELSATGLQRRAFGRLRLIPWQAIRSYQLRTSGVLCFRRDRPTLLDLPGSLFIPFPTDADDVVSALMQYLSRANELPNR